jgi:hypothetical protein
MHFMDHYFNQLQFLPLFKFLILDISHIVRREQRSFPFETVLLPKDVIGDAIAFVSEELVLQHEQSHPESLKLRLEPRIRF